MGSDELNGLKKQDEEPKKELPIIALVADCELRARTPIRKRTPSVEFTYKPMTAGKRTEWTRKLTEAERRNEGDAGILEDETYVMLTKYVTHVGARTNEGDDFDPTELKHWRSSPTKFVEDVAFVITGLDDEELEKRELKN